MYCPIRDKLIIEPIEQETSVNGLEIVRYYDGQPKRGQVISCGPEVNELKVSDAVVYGKYAFVQLDINGKTYHLLRESDILCKLKEVTDGDSG